MTVGSVLCLAAWWRASGQDLFEDQVGQANLALLGLVVASVFQVVWLRAGRLAVVSRRVRLLDDPGLRRNVGDIDDESSLFVAGDGLARYHRPGCRLAEGRHWPSRARDEQVGLGRRPCGVCRP